MDSERAHLSSAEIVPFPSQGQDTGRTKGQAPSQPPSVHIAKQFRDQNSISNETTSPLFCLTMSSQQLGAYGIGIQLYFSFLKNATILFFFISLMSLGTLYTNYQGNWLRDGQTKSPFDVLTLANQAGPDIYEKDLSTAEEYVESTKKNQQMILLFDLFYSFSFLIFLHAFAKVADNVAWKNRERFERPSDYTVSVLGLPYNTTEQEVNLHFSKFGEVAEVSFARNYNGKLFLYKKRRKISTKLEIAIAEARENGKENTAEIRKLRKEIRNFDRKIAVMNQKSQTPIEQLKIICAFVTFNQHNGKTSCEGLYLAAKSVFQSQPTPLQFRGIYTLEILHPPEPSELIWENFEIIGVSSKLRNCVSTAVTYVLLALTVGMLYGVSRISKKLPNAYDCREQALQNLSFEEAQEAYTDLDAKVCWCFLEGMTTILGDSNLQDYCEEYVSLWQNNLYIRILSSIGITIVNFFLKYVMRRISTFERNLTNSDQQISMLLKLFLAMALNTTFINLLFQSNEDSFSRNWYLDVGSVQVVTMLLCVFSPYILNLTVFYPAKRCKIVCCRRRKKTQSELNELYLGPEFNLASKTAVALNIISSCFFYSGGIPLLNIICFLSLFLIYWIEKMLIINHYRKPPISDQRVNTRSVKILILIITLHCFFSLFMYSSVTLWPAEYEENSDGIVVGKTTNTQRSINIPTIGMIIMTIFIFISFFSQRYIKGIVNSVFHICMPSFDGTRKNLEQTYVQAYAGMSERGIASYSIYANPEYSPLVQELDQAIKGRTQVLVERIESEKVSSEALFEGKARSSR